MSPPPPQCTIFDEGSVAPTVETFESNGSTTKEVSSVPVDVVPNDKNKKKTYSRELFSGPLYSKTYCKTKSLQNHFTRVQDLSYTINPANCGKETASSQAQRHTSIRADAPGEHKL